MFMEEKEFRYVFEWYDTKMRNDRRLIRFQQAKQACSKNIRAWSMMREQKEKFESN